MDCGLTSIQDILLRAQYVHSSIHDTSLNPRTRQEESTFQSPTHRSCSLLKRISPLLSPPPSEREQTVQLTAQETHGGAKLDQRGIEERRAARDAATGRRSLSSPIPIVEENGVDWMNCDGFLDYGLLDLSYAYIPGRSLPQYLCSIAAVAPGPQLCNWERRLLDGGGASGGVGYGINNGWLHQVRVNYACHHLIRIAVATF
ncbi:hypothetical protein D9611_014440 [Ephemerocybe angulata]|uniref:Uncharacterized protein n=1 Tax=Ephemerocybe angulata TaxID=980116 RepID=A0A8H5ERS0_9AGAR|nr:hypothetical protein D9611_014440 [Tulosesus angulatus]